jgi:murein L,D-transpeptidase YcbB/YkuD
LHDTPSKSLFGEDKRAFSHGCIRLAEPKRLAAYLLRKDTSWTDSRITKSMNAGKETWVTLNPTVPVFIVYFTAFVDRQGRLNFRDDIYKRDGRLAGMLMEKPKI